MEICNSIITKLQLTEIQLCLRTSGFLKGHQKKANQRFTTYSDQMTSNPSQIYANFYG